jgi:hydrogenase nickel incorporation protein HypB
MCSVCGCEPSAEDQERRPKHTRVSQILEIERDIFDGNNERASLNRSWLAAHGIFALNLVSSPGSGKTALLCRTLASLMPLGPCSVIEGDLQTSNDAERVRATGAPALQVNTGKGCHLDAVMIDMALKRLAPADDSLLFIENVGNLVCPAAFDLGEAHKVAVLSVSEGDDKPIKYPDIFHAASVMIVNKLDLLPHVDFDMGKCRDYARRVNPDIVILPLSAETGEGMDAWLAWIAKARHRPSGV